MLVLRHRVAVIHVMTLLITAFAAAEALLPASPSMYRDAAGIHVDGTVLTATRSPIAGMMYTGAATLLIRPGPNGAIEGYAATALDGHAVTGACIQRGESEHCSFSENQMTFTAEDTFQPAEHAWMRRYADGRTITIAVPQGTTAVPLALPLDSG